MERSFSIDHGRLSRYRAAADAARGESRAMQARLSDARLDVADAEAEARRLERSRPGSPRGVVRIDPDGRRHGRLESDHDRIVDQARRRAEAARDELARLAAEQSQGAARREHAQALAARLEEFARQNGVR